MVRFSCCMRMDNVSSTTQMVSMLRFRIPIADPLQTYHSAAFAVGIPGVLS